MVQLYAGENHIDSLRQKLDQALVEEKISILNDISMAYWHISLDHSVEYASEALELAINLNDKKGTADALNRLGNAEYLRTNYHDALDHYNHSLEIRLDIDDQEGILGSYNNLFLVHDQMGKKDISVHFLQKALELSVELEDKSEIAHYSNLMGSINIELHEFDRAEANIKRALDIYQIIEDSAGIASSYHNLGRMYQTMSLYDKALEQFFIALQLFKDINNINGIASVNNNIGIIHKHLNNYDIALDYYYQSLEIYREQGGIKRDVAALFNNIGIVWYEKEEYEMALDYYNQALESYESLKYNQGISITSHNIGMIFARTGNYRNAFESHMRSVEINKSSGDIFSLANNYNNLGELFLLQKDYNKALGFLEESLDMAIKINAKEIIRENYLFQSEIYRETFDYEKSLLFYELYDAYRDSIYTLDTGKTIAELQVIHDRERQISQLDILQKDNHIQYLKIRKQRSLLIFLWGLALITGLFLFVVLNISRHKKRLNLVLNEKNKQLENAGLELMNSEKNLQRLNKTKDKFFSIIAHDLKNPFNSLLGFTEMLSRNYKELSREQIYSYIDIINKSAINLYQLLENLLEWSKSQTGNIKYSPARFRIKNIAESEISTVQSYADSKNIKIGMNISTDTSAYADKSIISSVIRNLLNNAVKFTHHGGEIIISASENENYIELSVSDNGIGIGPREQKKLFNLEYNITTSGTNDEKGTGLGLLLCKEFIEKSGGKLWVDSKVGEGSKFTFRIPK